MSSKRINITVPEKDLEEIKRFCIEEKMSRSQLIREAAVEYMVNIKGLKEKEKKKRDLEWAMKTQEKIRDKSRSFPSGKSATEIIRGSRDLG